MYQGPVGEASATTNDKVHCNVSENVLANDWNVSQVFDDVGIIDTIFNAFVEEKNCVVPEIEAQTKPGPLR
jgi:hypothetical protein